MTGSLDAYSSMRVDHLDGHLLVDRLPKRVRKNALKELREEALGLE